MEKLYKGIHTFRKDYFKRDLDFFQRLSTGQRPDVLFITCADSRVDPNLVTQSRPGELFIVRNVGNIIPPYYAIKDKNSVAAALEFGVLSLKVSDIIVCGHSNCGAMQALIVKEMERASMPHLSEWLELSEPVRKIVEHRHSHSSLQDRLRITEEENVLLQLQNLQSYPFVSEALEAGRLHIHGWYYDIGSGKVCSYNPAHDQFEDVI